MAKPIVVYQYPNCSTCRKALKWLDAQGIDHRAIDLVATPPSAAVLGQVLERSGLELRKLFNVSGQSYREGGWKERIATIGRAEALAALAADGKLIKRPIALADELALVGFDPDAWAAALT
ncbi:Spx/MgsR family RNA polymerase-binding regulatory protein [Nannocystaceae bacterium ST9]